MNSTNELEDLNNLQKASSQEQSTSKIPVIEERLKVGVKQVETGSVQIHKKIISQDVSQEVPITHEEVTINHVPINQYIDVAPAVRYEGDNTIISVVKEVLVVEKRLMLVEELHISKKQIISTATVKETLRKEEVEINRTDANNTLPNQ
jgi:uncharacterized protein (TIGR02271 family)